MGDTGLEQSALTQTKTAISKTRGAKCGTLDDKNDSDLAEIVRLWPDLPERTRTAIKALIEKHRKEQT